MSNVKRNDPCPCGSGKKYKKCCMKEQTVSVTQLIEEEVSQAQADVIDFTTKNHQMQVRNSVESALRGLNIPEQAQTMFSFQAILWTLMHERLAGDQTIMEEYIHKNSGKWKRDRVRHIVQSWNNGGPFFGEVVESSTEECDVVDIFSGEERRVKYLTKEQQPNKGNVLIGFMLPYEEQWVVFEESIILQDKDTNLVVQHLKGLFQSSGEETLQDWLWNSYLQLVWEALYRKLEIRPGEQFEWKNEKEKSVASLLKEAFQKDNIPEEIAQFGLSLWHTYCIRKAPKIRNERIYGAAIHYLVTQLTSMNTKTQQELSDLYDATSSSISSRYREMETVLEDELGEFHRAVQELEQKMN
ncbi:SEC-C domain-containing protein [Bacillus tianshenii]|nr:SEC-C domain-containing protein [Bacillus tianshenii]